MRNNTISVLLVALLFIVSCSGGGSSPVTSPDITPPDLQIASDPGYANHHLWGYYTVNIDPGSLQAEITPIRGVQFTCNVTQFTQPPISPINMVSLSILSGSDPATGYFEVDVTLKHPFPGIPFYRGFDVRGVLIADGSYATDLDPDVVYGGNGDCQLLNADGLTRWWNPSEFTSYDSIFGYTIGKLGPPVFPNATINGYKYFADELEYDDPAYEVDPASRGNFPTIPGIYTRPYFIQFTMDGSQVDLTFNYAIDASWAEPDPAGEPGYELEYYPLDANCQEPYAISVADNGSTAYYVSPSDNGGELNLQVGVYDWQAAENPEGVPGEIDALWLESPMFSAPVDILSTATVHPGGPTSSVYEVSIGSLNLTKSGDEPLLVFAETSDGIGYEPQIPGGSAFDYPDAPLGAYLLTTVDILSVGGNPPIVISIDPDAAQSGDFLTDVIVTGQYFQNGAQVELRHPDWDPIEAEAEVMSGGGTIITCDFDLDAAAQGLWDVYVINPDMLFGYLEEGFAIDCGEGLHEYDGQYTMNGGLYWNYCQRGDLTILETGAHAGECVVKRAYNSAGNSPGYYVRFDPDSPASTPESDYFELPGRVDSVVTYITMTASIDQNPANGHMGVINGRMFDYVQIVDENGNHLEDVVVPSTPDTYDERYPVIPAVDFDVDGDLWLVVDIRGEWHPAAAPSKLDPIWQLRHYELQTASPYYVENTDDRLDISEYLYDSGAEPYGHMWYVADCAISYVEDSLFIFSSTIQGWNHSLFTKFDISTSPPSWVTNIDLAPQILSCSHPYSGISRADIEFDHSDLSAENCRLMVLYQTWSGQVDNHLMRIDTDFNVLSDEIIGAGFGSWDNPHAIAFNVDDDNRNLIAIDMASAIPHNDFYYFTHPASGW